MLSSSSALNTVVPSKIHMFSEWNIQPRYRHKSKSLALGSTRWSSLSGLTPWHSYYRILLQAVCIHVDLWPLMSEPIPDGAPSRPCNLTASLPLPVKLILCSTSWSFSVTVTGYSAMMTLLFWECVCEMVRCMSLHQNVKTGETFWWLLRIDECAVDDKSAVGLRTHSLAWSSCFWAFSKVMSLCHLYPLHLFTWLVVHTLLGITGKVACSFGLNWPTSLGCNGCQTCWCFVHSILLSLYLARWLSGHAWHPVWWYKHAGWGLGLL